MEGAQIIATTLEALRTGLIRLIKLFALVNLRQKQCSILLPILKIVVSKSGPQSRPAVFLKNLMNFKFIDLKRSFAL